MALAWFGVLGTPDAAPVEGFSRHLGTVGTHVTAGLGLVVAQDYSTWQDCWSLRFFGNLQTEFLEKKNQRQNSSVKMSLVKNQGNTEVSKYIPCCNRLFGAELLHLCEVIRFTDDRS